MDVESSSDDGFFLHRGATERTYDLPPDDLGDANICRRSLGDVPQLRIGWWSTGPPERVKQCAARGPTVRTLRAAK
jgi:hypothetical protein